MGEERRRRRREEEEGAQSQSGNEDPQREEPAPTAATIEYPEQMPESTEGTIEYPSGSLHAKGFRQMTQKFEETHGPGMIPPCQRCYNPRPLRVTCRRCNVVKLCGQCLGHLCERCEAEAQYEKQPCSGQCYGHFAPSQPTWSVAPRREPPTRRCSQTPHAISVNTYDKSG